MLYIIRIEDTKKQVTTVQIDVEYLSAFLTLGLAPGETTFTCVTPGMLKVNDGLAGFGGRMEANDCYLHAGAREVGTRIVMLAGFLDGLYCAGGGTGSILPGGGKLLQEGAISWTQMN